MTDKKARKPYTIIETIPTPHGDKDVGFLCYGDKSLRLNPNEYGMVSSLLSPAGLDLLDISEERAALIRTQSSRILSEFISDKILGSKLAALRKKIDLFFEGELIIPRASTGNGRRSGLRIYTRQEIEEIHQKMQKPGKGIVYIKDERGISHIFINEKEITLRPRRPITYLQCVIIQLAASRRGFNPGMQEFKSACHESTGREIPRPTLLNYITNIRSALQQSEMQLTKAETGWLARRVEYPTYFLIPRAPAGSISSPKLSEHALP